MFYVTVGFAAGAALLVLRWVARRQSSRDVNFPAISVASCAVIAVVASLPIVVRMNLESRLSHDASRLIGIDVTVRCQTLTGSTLDLGNELGYVKWTPDGGAEHATLIKHQQCNDLESYLDSNKSHPSAGEVLAVHVLSHESMHMAGNLAESVAECYAMQHDTKLAEIMGAAPQAAHELSVRYWKTVYPFMPAAYRSANCRKGGSLDLNLPDAPWSG